MEHFVIIVNGWKPLTIITKSYILDVAAVLDPPLYWEKYFSRVKAGLRLICNGRAYERAEWGEWLASHRAIRWIVEVHSTTEQIHWLPFIHASWTTELEIRLDNEISEAVREKCSLK